MISVRLNLTCLQIIVHRYYAIKLSHKNQRIDDPLALKRSTQINGGLLAMGLLYILCNVVNGLPYSIGNELCLQGESTASQTSPAIITTEVLTGALDLIGWTLAIAFDILIVFEARKIEAIAENRQHLRQKKFIKKLFYSIPIRATTYSTLTAFSLLAVAVLLNVAGAKKGTISMSMIILTLSILATRFPLSTIIIFTKKRKQDLRSREERQRRENEYAAQERAQREMRKMVAETASKKILIERLESTFSLHI